MKDLGSRITKALTLGSKLVCIDNSGAKEVEIIGVIGYRGVHKRKPKAGVGDMVVVSVKSGDIKVRKQIFKAVIVRQKKEWRRPNGMRIRFEDNAAVLVNDNGEPKGTIIKGAIAKEVAIRFPKVSAIAQILV